MKNDPIPQEVPDFEGMRIKEMSWLPGGCDDKDDIWVVIEAWIIDEDVTPIHLGVHSWRRDNPITTKGCDMKGGTDWHGSLIFVENPPGVAAMKDPNRMRIQDMIWAIVGCDYYASRGIKEPSIIRESWIVDNEIIPKRIGRGARDRHRVRVTVRDCDIEGGTDWHGSGILVKNLPHRATVIDAKGVRSEEHTS